MATQSPFSLLADALGKLAGNLKAPSWLVDELQHRLVLFINHVLMQEPEAQARAWRASRARGARAVARLLDATGGHAGRAVRAGAAWPRPTCC
jgi:hypothetical protein